MNNTPILIDSLILLSKVEIVVNKLGMREYGGQLHLIIKKDVVYSSINFLPRIRFLGTFYWLMFVLCYWQILTCLVCLSTKFRQMDWVRNSWELSRCLLRLVLCCKVIVVGCWTSLLLESCTSSRYIHRLISILSLFTLLERSNCRRRLNCLFVSIVFFY